MVDPIGRASHDRSCGIACLSDHKSETCIVLEGTPPGFQIPEALFPSSADCLNFEEETRVPNKGLSACEAVNLIGIDRSPKTPTTSSRLRRPSPITHHPNPTRTKPEVSLTSSTPPTSKSTKALTPSPPLPSSLLFSSPKKKAWRALAQSFVNTLTEYFTPYLRNVRSSTYIIHYTYLRNVRLSSMGFFSSIPTSESLSSQSQSHFTPSHVAQASS